MNDFNTLFPNFLNQCAEMNRVLMPIAFVLLAIGVVSSTVTGHRSPSAYLRTIGRTFAFIAVLAYLPTWGNEVAAIVDTTVKETLKADPAGVYDQYQKTLAVSKGDDRRFRFGLKVMVGPAGYAGALRNGDLRGDVAARISGERHRLLRLPGAEVHSLRSVCSGADLHRLSGRADAPFDWRRIPPRVCGRALLAPGLGCGIAPYLRSDRLHDRSKFPHHRRSKRGRRLWTAKFTGPGRAGDLADCQHHRRPNHHSESDLNRNAGRAGLAPLSLPLASPAPRRALAPPSRLEAAAELAASLAGRSQAPQAQPRSEPPRPPSAEAHIRRSAISSARWAAARSASSPPTPPQEERSDRRRRRA